MKIFRKVLWVLVLLGVGCLCRGSSAPAQGALTWANLGLYGGQIYDIAIDPLTPAKMFAGSYLGDGLFVTTDGGDTWQAVEASNDPPGEATFKNHAVWAVQIAPSDHNVIWVAHDRWVEKSTDGGLTWSHIYNRDMQRDCTNCGGESDDFRFCHSIAIHPSDPNTVYVGTGGPDEQAANGAMYKTTDGGITWKKLNGGANFYYSVTRIAFDTNNPQIMWAITGSREENGTFSGRLYRSGDGGDTWEWKIWVNTSWYDLALKPDEPNVVFLATWFGILRVVFDPSGSFLSYTAPLGWQPGLNVRSLSFDPQDPGTLYAAWNVTKVSRSSDGGKTFGETFEVGYQFLVLAVHPTERERLFGGELTRGVYRSENHGQNWIPINEGINAVIVYDVSIDPLEKTHILAATIAGVYEKRDVSSWSLISNFPFTKSFVVKFDPVDAATYYAGTEGTLAKTLDGGSSWTYSNYLSYNKVVDIAIDPTDRNRIYLIVDGSYSGNGGVYKSTDGGATFGQVFSATALKDQGLIGEEYSFNVIAIDPSDHQHLFAGGGNYYAPKVLGDLWESRDGGASWARTGLQNVIVNALLIDARNAQVIYAGCGYSGGTDVPVYKSTDGGVSWNASYEGIPTAPVAWNAVTDLEFHRTNPSIVYASTTLAGVYVSPNEGRNWLNLGTPEYDVFAISTSSLYGGTQGGLYQCTGTGVIAGKVTDADTQSGIDGATVFTDLGVKTISVQGEFMMVHPSGIFTVTAVADGHANMTLTNTVVLGGDVTMTDMPMTKGVAGPLPGESAGGDGGGGGACFITTSAEGYAMTGPSAMWREVLEYAFWRAFADRLLSYEKDGFPLRSVTLRASAMVLVLFSVLASRTRRWRKGGSNKTVATGGLL